MFISFKWIISKQLGQLRICKQGFEYIKQEENYN